MLSLVIHARHEGCDIAICNDQNLYSPHESQERHLTVCISILLLTN